MTNFPRLTAAALALSMLALPAVADAKPKAGPAKVRAHARAANAALDRAVGHLTAGRDARAARALAVQSRKLRKAKRLSVKLAEPRSARSLRATGSVAGVADRCVALLSTLVSDAGVPAQLDVAEAVTECLQVRDQLAARLTELAPLAAESLQPYLAQLIQALSADSVQELAAILEALELPNLSPEVAEALSLALDELELILAGQYPEGFPVDLLDQLPDGLFEQLPGLLDLVPEGFFDELPAGLLDGLPPEVLDQLPPGLLDLLDDLLG